MPRGIAAHRARGRETGDTLHSMCYSSQIAAAYQQYLKLTGASIDLDQFREMYGFRHANSAIRIPRAVDRWFNEPKNADETLNQGTRRSAPDRGNCEARG